MPVTDEMVATIRVFIAGDREEFRRRNAALDPSPEARRAYTTLISAAFAHAVERKFTAQSPREEIIGYVADVRARSAEAAERVEQEAAESLVAAVFDGSVDIGDIDAGTRLAVELGLLIALISDEGPGAAELDRFVENARKSADKALG